MVITVLWRLAVENALYLKNLKGGVWCFLSNLTDELREGWCALLYWRGDRALLTVHSVRGLGYPVSLCLQMSQGSAVDSGVGAQWHRIVAAGAVTPRFPAHAPLLVQQI